MAGICANLLIYFAFQLVFQPQLTTGTHFVRILIANILGFASALTLAVRLRASVAGSKG
eukprot:CAMPEP_0184359158 /NCGR_PEP_ID=MMETSP1089-20130417/118730_1 /TAXON_ID=38269 ORGANISM="Gloeochaete wittrockiana, Strain SAG46.84" /NCGR_SAMPLE_ID=MMETSP1089 /ASSEMBLY_ACC=CAM_ASM_000445 /LENGTH=58 /DNA_ID=CAMNT_0026697837 /DNA_START=19 /DNA_END=191 /DNA_ORIENTATION=+